MSLFYKRNKYIKKSKEKVGDIMTSLKTANRRVGSLFAVAALVLATVTPGLVPAFASAAQVTNRSVELSSSSRDADGVDYTVKFTTVGSTGAATVLQFCNDTPLIGAACSLPAGFSAASATATGFTVAQTTEAVANAIVVTGAVNGSVTIPLEGVNNPANAGPLYVRIITYSNATDAEAYTATALGNNVVDQGSAAVSITDTVGVSGAVLESMTFCVAGEAITTESCTDSELLDAPTLKLGQTNGDVVALDAGFLSEGSIYSQLSTNASSGAIVSLKSTAVGCGGLLRSGATDPEECNILPALNTGITAGQAKFGVKTNTAAGVGTNFNGTLQPASGSIYGNSAFALNYVDGDGSGVTGPFGDPFLDTNDTPVNNMGMQITFGASISNNTPAGLYSTDLSLIATGKF